jgi:hypothetical protein
MQNEKDGDECDGERYRYVGSRLSFLHLVVVFYRYCFYIISAGVSLFVLEGHFVRRTDDVKLKGEPPGVARASETNIGLFVGRVRTTSRLGSPTFTFRTL